MRQDVSAGSNVDSYVGRPLSSAAHFRSSRGMDSVATPYGTATDVGSWAAMSENGFTARQGSRRTLEQAQQGGMSGEQPAAAGARPTAETEATVVEVLQQVMLAREHSLRELPPRDLRGCVRHDSRGSDTRSEFSDAIQLDCLHLEGRDGSGFLSDRSRQSAAARRRRGDSRSSIPDLEESKGSRSEAKSARSPSRTSPIIAEKKEVW